MNLSSEDVQYSFSNIGFFPSDDDEDDVQSSTSVDNGKERRRRTNCDQKKTSKSINQRALLAATPRVVCRTSSTNRSTAYFTKTCEELELFEPIDDLLADVTENSQGYRFFNNNKRFCTSATFNLLPKVVDLSHRLKDLLSRRISKCHVTNPVFFEKSENDDGDNYSDSIGIERARDGGREHINLSEIFSENHHRRENFEQKSPNDFVSEQVESVAKNQKDQKQSTMGSLHRSEEMKLYQMILIKEAAYDCCAEIGKSGNVQFVDLNFKQGMYTRTFVKQIRRCEEMERKLRFLEKQVVTCSPEIEPQSIDFDDLSAPNQAQIMEIELRLDQLEKEFLDLNRNDYQLRRNLNSAKEYFQCLAMVDDFFNVHKDEDTKAKLERTSTHDDDLDVFSKSFGFGAGAPVSSDVPLTPLLQVDEENAWFVAGVLPWDKKSSFERVLWRACRRTAFVNTSNEYFVITDPVTLEPQQKCIFIIFFKGDSLRQIVEKVCNGFNATQYPCPKLSTERKLKMGEMDNRIHDLTIVIDTTQTHRYTILKSLSIELPDWLKSIQIQKSVYHVMNMFTVDTNGFLAGECWIPVVEEDQVRHALSDGYRKSGAQVEPILNPIPATTTPPTLHKTNKFTKVFQTIVDSYGVSNYCEVNPAPYTIITFPFLFAMMFGDTAHGLILLLAALYLILNEKVVNRKKIRDEIFNTFFGGRYIMLLMGIFSVYTGMLYNDTFAKSINVFGSAWKNPYNQTLIEKFISRGLRKNREYLLEFIPEASYENENGPYPFGVDPIWNIAENRLNFLNSLKMKASVIIGIAQMTFGVFLSCLNHWHFKSHIDILTNFIPQIIFLSAIFVYLCIQIVVKWIFFSVKPEQILGYNYPGSNCAPSLLIGLINMFMFRDRNLGFVDKAGKNYPNCHLGYWYPNQGIIEKTLLMVALTCVPIMLLGKPLWIHFVTNRRQLAREKKEAQSTAALKLLSNGGERRGTVDTALAIEDEHLEEPSENVELLQSDELDLDEDVHHSMSDIFVHQAIHTIEFVLGCVSHTASYLRLWALSLAHAQLSEVMWHMVLMQGLHVADNVPEYLSGVVVALTFSIFAILSLSILIMMEGLSAFLHALRLHWVEFQSKFYVGTGHPFHAFYLKENLEVAQLITEEADRIADISRTS